MKPFEFEEKPGLERLTGQLNPDTNPVRVAVRNVFRPNEITQNYANHILLALGKEPIDFSRFKEDLESKKNAFRGLTGAQRVCLNFAAAETERAAARGNVAGMLLAYGKDETGQKWGHARSFEQLPDGRISMTSNGDKDKVEYASANEMLEILGSNSDPNGIKYEIANPAGFRMGFKTTTLEQQRQFLGFEAAPKPGLLNRLSGAIQKITGIYPE